MAPSWVIAPKYGVIARLARRVNVMYAGYIIESGPIKRIFGNPQHPYTIGLLGSVPQADGTGQTLQYIDGAPPDLIRLPQAEAA